MYVIGRRDGDFVQLLEEGRIFTRRAANEHLRGLNEHSAGAHSDYEVFSLTETNGPIGDPA